MGSLATLFTYGLPLNYYSNLAEQISVVDAQAVQEVAKKYLVPDKFVVVAVGDRSKIGDGLEKELGDAPPKSATLTGSPSNSKFVVIHIIRTLRSYLMGVQTTDSGPRRAATVLDLIGNTPLIRLRKFEAGLNGVELYGKAEWFNPGRVGERSSRRQHGARRV